MLMMFIRPLNQSNQAAFNQVQSQLSKADNLSGISNKYENALAVTTSNIDRAFYLIEERRIKMVSNRAI